MTTRAGCLPRLLLGALLSPALLLYSVAARADDQTEKAAARIESVRAPKDEKDLQRWLENMIWHHRFTAVEVRAATGLSEDEIAAAQKRFNIFPRTKPAHSSRTSLLVLPYPGGRHPRAGFRDGAIKPQRETKVSIFPFGFPGYVVADVPEGIWSNLGLTYLAHTHVPTIWTKQGIELEKLEWERPPNGTLSIERRLPNGISFSTRVIPDRDVVWFEMSLTNGTPQLLTDLRVQNCLLLGPMRGFNEQSNDNKIVRGPYVAVHDSDNYGYYRWIVTAWQPLHRTWTNPPCPCLHSDPIFPDCPPGATRHVRGLVAFYKGRDIDTFLRRLDQLDWPLTRSEGASPHSWAALESPAQAKRRHERISKRRAGVAIICHRGAVEFAHENTLEAYRGSFELGADGNEIDVRMTKDGMLVCFHDDMLDRLVELYGDASDFTWPDLRVARFRNPGWLGDDCRIPTLSEALELHREHAALIHLDLKQSGMDTKIAQMLDALDMWDHVISAPAGHGAAIVTDKRYRPLKYKTQLYTDDRDIDRREVEQALKLDGTALIVDDPRAAILARRRWLGNVSTKPLRIASEIGLKRPRQASELEEALAMAAEAMQPVSAIWALLVRPSKPTSAREDDRIEYTAGERAEFRANLEQLAKLNVLARARFADAIGRSKTEAADAPVALVDMVRTRSLHTDWRLHGLDGEAALRALVGLQAPQAVDVARECLWRDDAALDSVRDAKYDNPRTWHDWRIKTNVFEQLETLPGEATEKLCRYYLALSNEAARKLGPPQFSSAAECLLIVCRDEATALELMKDSRPTVRNRAVKVCLRYTSEAWAVSALRRAGPHALAYIPPNH